MVIVTKKHTHTDMHTDRQAGRPTGTEADRLNQAPT